MACKRLQNVPNADQMANEPDVGELWITSADAYKQFHFSRNTQKPSQHHGQRLRTKWNRRLCAERELEPVATYAELADKYGSPQPRGPFSLNARCQAGFTEEELRALESYVDRLTCGGMPFLAGCISGR